MYRVKGYLLGAHPEIHRIEVDSLTRARVVASELTKKGYVVEIRGPDGKIVEIN